MMIVMAILRGRCVRYDILNMKGGLRIITGM
jgi:hypothetical protein